MAGEYGRHSLYKMLGYFSLVGLLRLHSLLGDYYQAIKVLENIELNKKVSNCFLGLSASVRASTTERKEDSCSLGRLKIETRETTAVKI